MSLYSHVIGIDIGKNGAIVAINLSNDKISTFPMPLKKVNKKKEVDYHKIVEILKKFKYPFIIFEKITTIYGVGKSGFGSLMEQVGSINIICEFVVSCQFVGVPPRTWQKKMFETIEDIRDKDNKRETKVMALEVVKQLFPKQSLVFTSRQSTPKDGLVDALLMAQYAKTYII